MTEQKIVEILENNSYEISVMPRTSTILAWKKRLRCNRGDGIRQDCDRIRRQVREEQKDEGAMKQSKCYKDGNTVLWVSKSVDKYLVRRLYRTCRKTPCFSYGDIRHV